MEQGLLARGQEQEEAEVEIWGKGLAGWVVTVKA